MMIFNTPNKRILLLLLLLRKITKCSKKKMTILDACCFDQTKLFETVHYSTRSNSGQVPAFVQNSGLSTTIVDTWQPCLQGEAQECDLPNKATHSVWECW